MIRVLLAENSGRFLHTRLNKIYAKYGFGFAFFLSSSSSSSSKKVLRKLVPYFPKLTHYFFNSWPLGECIVLTPKEQSSVALYHPRLLLLTFTSERLRLKFDTLFFNLATPLRVGTNRSFALFCESWLEENSSLKEFVRLLLCGGWRKTPPQRVLVTAMTPFLLAAGSSRKH
jgi:hypothetical protein